MKQNFVLVLAVTVLVGAGLHYAWELISIGVAYKTKVLCSCVFVSKRSPEAVLNGDLAVDDLAVLRYIDSEIDNSTHQVSSSFLGLFRQTAVYHPGFGCTLEFPGYDRQELRAPSVPVDNPSSSQWLERQSKDNIAKRGGRNPLQVALDWAFSESNPERLRRTRAVVVVRNGQIVGERYASGFDQNTPLIGWSMTKSVVHALIGVLVRQGKLSLASPVEAPEWRGRNEPLPSITVATLMEMTSGLAFNEDYTNPLADVTYMLLRTPDMARYAASKELVVEPGLKWSYSSGSTNILSRVIRYTVGEANYPLFPRRALFEPLRMESAVLEPDASGTFVGSSYMYASARDWAKFGLLYLQGGVWEGRRILPENWVEYATTPVVRAGTNAYGAHFWLKIPEEYATGGAASRLPKDAFHAVGHEGQFLTIIPSCHLVIVRLGLTRYASAWQHDRFVINIMEALKC